MDDEIFYTDKRGGRDHECLSLGADHEPVLAGRTPLQTYADFVAEFAAQCQKNDLWGARAVHLTHATFYSWMLCIIKSGKRKDC